MDRYERLNKRFDELYQQKVDIEHEIETTNDFVEQLEWKDMLVDIQIEMDRIARIII
jgi:predicted  nucleic acid-binding Zn-ribbon protein